LKLRPTDRIVKLHLVDHLSTNNLLHSFHSAYIKHHSIETTLLSVHDHIIDSMSYQQVTCLTLYLLNSAFNRENFKSFVFQFLYAVPQRFVHGPFLAANHHLYAIDIQFLLTFSALNFSYNITHLEKTITNVSNWMSFSFLSLNPSKLSF